MANRFAGLADAYTNWGAAVANEKLQSDPFYQFTQIAAQAAQEHDAYSARKAFRQQMDGEANPERGIAMTNMGGGG